METRHGHRNRREGSQATEAVAGAEQRLLSLRGDPDSILADYNVARFFADAEALYSYEGTYQMQHLIVGKAVTGFSAFI